MECQTIADFVGKFRGDTTARRNASTIEPEWTREKQLVGSSRQKLKQLSGSTTTGKLGHHSNMGAPYIAQEAANGADRTRA